MAEANLGAAWELNTPGTQKVFIEGCMPAARIAVKHMKSAFKQGWACGVNIEEIPENCHWISAAESRGLIPPPSPPKAENNG